MLRRVVVAGVSICALGLTFGFSQTANADDCWIDAKTGQSVSTIPGGAVYVGPYRGGGGGRTKEVYVGYDGIADPNHAYNPNTGQNFVRVPCPPTQTTGVSGGVEVSMSLGASSTSTSVVNTSIFSAGVPDAVTDNRTNPSGTGFVGGVGVSVPLLEFGGDVGGGPVVKDHFWFWGSGNRNKIENLTSRYAPEAKNAYAAYFPLKAPPKQQSPRITMGFDGNVYFFAGGDQTITGIPGGPFGTATGADSFRISNNYMFTVGGFITAPITPTWRVSLTGGLAELNQTVKYNCVTFCAVLPATPAFTVSQDKWVTGGYIGGRLAMPVALPGFPGASIGLDYKHVFFGNYNVALGTIPTRQVNARLSPDMDLVTLRLGVPFR